ncbi:hypothetical protein PYJP_20020 [Pyrofollis japonicus]|uniref:hypothetical protein n=1 Tax=Pyrofollis japonicus TaxID=3060460 RepID=UPI00295B3354|nr:hypothetical protein [Pyrofollis japonicus]BEP18650.1 hypothetical protein PYJP_20020 [Pyrofollis japonicus]
MLADAILIRSGSVYRDKILLLLERNHVLIKPLQAYWGGVDEALRNGIEPLMEPRIGGSSGAGTVVEAGVDALPDIRGRFVALAGIGKKYFPPLVGNGFLSTYAVVPYSMVAEAPRKEYAPLLLYAALACHAADELELRDAYSVAVLGAGLFALLVSHIAQERGLSVSIYPTTKESERIAKELGLRINPSLEQLGSDIDAAIISLYDTVAVEHFLARSEPRIAVIHPLLAFTGIRVSPSDWTLIVTPRGGKRYVGCAVRVLERLWQKISKYIGFVEGLAPPPDCSKLPVLGLIYRVTS